MAPSRTTSQRRSRGSGAERDPDPELLRPPRHQERQHRVDAEAAQRQGEERGRHQHRRRRRGHGRRVGQHRVQAAHVVDDDAARLLGQALQVVGDDGRRQPRVQDGDHLRRQPPVLERHVGGVRHVERAVDPLGLVAGQRVGADVGDDADDRAPARFADEADVLPHRLPSRPEPARGGGRHLDDRFAGAVALGERPAAGHPQAHHAAVVRRHDGEPEQRRGLPRRHRVALDLERSLGDAAGERQHVDERGAADAGHGPQPVFERAMERQAARRLAAVRVVGRQPRGDEAAGAEARVDARQRPQAADEEARGDHEQRGAGDLAGGQQPPDAAGRGAAARAAAGVQHGAQLQAQRVRDGRQAEGRPGDDREQGAEEQRAPLEHHRAEPRRLRRQDAREHGQERPGEQEPDGRADAGEQEMLGQELPGDAAGRAADRGPDADLALAGGGARQAQVGDVGAGDHQDDQRRRRQDAEPRGDAADERRLQRHDDEIAVPVVGHRPRELLAHVALEQPQFGLGLRRA